MKMDRLGIFHKSVERSRDLPDEVRQYARYVKEVRPTIIDRSYMEVLESQIRLSTRGPQWTQRLQNRRDTFRPYCNQSLLKGRIEIGIKAYWILVDPQEQQVVYWELYEDWSERLKP